MCAGMKSSRVEDFATVGAGSVENESPTLSPDLGLDCGSLIMALLRLKHSPAEWRLPHLILAQWQRFNVSVLSPF
jgi:hypothetical protein